MYRKIIKVLFIVFLSFSLYGFSRPATDEDELRKLWIKLGSHELVFDNVPVTDYLVLMLNSNTNLTHQVGEPDYLSYKNSMGEGGQFVIYFRTRGGGRTYLNFIWIRPFDKNIRLENTLYIDHLLGFHPPEAD